LRELLNTSTALWDGVSELDDKFLEGAPDHIGQLPVVKLAGVIERPSRQGSTFAPVFEIVRWVPRSEKIPKPTGVPKLTDMPLLPLATKTQVTSIAKSPAP
jgi:hypothetical protein